MLQHRNANKHVNLPPSKYKRVEVDDKSQSQCIF